MGDSACLVHGFSYASAIPNESKQGNPMHTLGESISFGSFMTESLSWEKWSTFSHKKYVEEAERYAQPGSVAQKKAFFEAHYKRIAAQKAAALLEQENGAKAEAGEVGDDKEAEEDKIEDAKGDEKAVLIGNEDSREIQVDNVETKDRVSVSESNGVTETEKSSVKNSILNEDITSATSKKRSNLPSSKTTIQNTWKIPPAPAKPVTPCLNKENNVPQSTMKPNVDSIGKKRPSSNSLRVLMNLVPNKDPDKEPILPTKKTENLMTPNSASTKDVSTYPAATPRSENRRMKTPSDTSVAGSKRTGRKWYILSAVCSKSSTAHQNKIQASTLSTPYVQRTGERAAKRKQKLEEIFNASEVDKIQLQKTFKEKAGNELRILGCVFCFKARPSPEFNKEKETPKSQMKTTPAAEIQKAVLGRSISNKKQGTVSVPPPPPIYLAKNSASKNISKMNVLRQSKCLADSLPERNTHENASPNIQQ